MATAKKSKAKSKSAKGKKPARTAAQKRATAQLVARNKERASGADTVTRGQFNALRADVSKLKEKQSGLEKGVMIVAEVLEQHEGQIKSLQKSRDEVFRRLGGAASGSNDQPEAGWRRFKVA